MDNNDASDMHSDDEIDTPKKGKVLSWLIICNFTYVVLLLNNPITEVALMIPARNPELGIPRRLVPFYAEFPAVLVIIYESIGCEAAVEKPNKLGNALKKDGAVSLASEDDWKGLLDSVKEAQLRQKRDLQQLPSRKKAVTTKTTTVKGKKGVKDGPPLRRK